MIIQAGPPPKMDRAHEHSWFACDSDLLGYPTARCKVCLEWRIDTPLGVFPSSPLLAFYLFNPVFRAQDSPSN